MDIDEDLLKRVEKQESEAKEFGFYWENLSQLIEQVKNECVEIQEAWDSGSFHHLQEEVGDLIQASISLAIFCKLNPHETLLKSIEKFQRRYDALVELVKIDGHVNLQNQPFEVLLNYWKLAKAKTGTIDS